mgnify:FL=1
MYNNTGAPVTTTIMVTPTIYNNNGTINCTLSPETFNVTINPFQIVCPSNIGPVDNTSEQCYATVTTPNPTFIGTCTANRITWQLTGATVANSPGTGINYVGTRNFNIGVTTVTYTATNTFGVSTTCSYTVTVADTGRPVIDCPDDITQAAATGLCSAIVNYTAPVGTDNCTGAVTTQIAGLPSGSAFPVGTTVNTFRVTDAAGNTADCSFNVTITDNQPPVFTSCPSDIPRTTDAGVCTSTFDPEDPVVSDNCLSLLQLTWSLSGATLGDSPATGINYVGNTAFNLGTTTITYTATDPGGNSSVCTFNVVVTDNQDPTISCPSSYSVYNDPGLCSAVINTSDPVTEDNCGVQSLVWTMSGATSGSGTNNIGSYTFNVGITTVTYIVTDNSDRTAQCQFIVEVIDNELPVLQCPASPQNRNTDLNTCAYTAEGTEFDPNISDNCPGYNLSNNLNGASTLAGYVFPRGTTNVIWTITDNALNQHTCSFNVVVTDVQLPTISTCPATREITGCSVTAITGPSYSSSEAISTYAIFSDATNQGVASDNCTIASVRYQDVANGSCPIEVQRTWSIRDESGNLTTCIQTITVTEPVLVFNAVSYTHLTLPTIYSV